jgi:hypothetical protein
MGKEPSANWVNFRGGCPAPWKLKTNRENYMKNNKKNFKLGNIRIYYDLSGDEIVKTVVQKKKIEIHVNPRRAKPYMIKHELKHTTRLYWDEVLKELRETANRKIEWHWALEIIKFQEQNRVIPNPLKLLEGNKS